MPTKYSFGNLKSRGHLEDLVVDGRIILKWIWKTGWKGVCWFHVAQVRDQWRAVVNLLMDGKRREFLDQLSDCLFSRRDLLHFVINVFSPL
jgi:hypothetical protein